MTNTVPGLGSITSSLMLTRRGNILAPFTIFHHDQYKLVAIIAYDMNIIVIFLLFFYCSLFSDLTIFA